MQKHAERKREREKERERQDICGHLILAFNVDGDTMEVCLYSDTYTHILYIFTNNGILLIIIDNLAVKLNKYIT